jgi:hypothetical protein
MAGLHIANKKREIVWRRGFESVGLLAYRLERSSEPNGSRASLFCVIEKKRGYLRFLNNISASGVVVTY